jgi:Mg2+/Co2+ transporter CorB
LFFFKEKGYVYQEKFENTKGIIRRRQRIQWPKEKDKCRNNDLQNIAAMR